ncbi:MAG: hypothetical protein LLF89_06390 [Spirochaetaceae bacterium]|nr:hypothetical protein [Spirochaetaceae bacterium]
MSISEYLDSSPLDLVKYGEHGALDAIFFIGTVRKHPYDQDKCLLLATKQDNTEWLHEGTIIEFRMEDVVGADELPSPVDEQGFARSLVRLWIRRGAIGLKYEPFEVGEKPLQLRDSEMLRKKLAHFYRPSHE